MNGQEYLQELAALQGSNEEEHVDLTLTFCFSDVEEVKREMQLEEEFEIPPDEEACAALRLEQDRKTYYDNQVYSCYPGDSQANIAWRKLFDELFQIDFKQFSINYRLLQNYHGDMNACIDILTDDDKMLELFGARYREMI